MQAGLLPAFPLWCSPIWLAKRRKRKQREKKKDERDKRKSKERKEQKEKTDQVLAMYGDLYGNCISA